MNSVPYLTPKTAEKLQTAIDSLYQLVEQGISPTGALEKVAEDFNLPPQQITLVARAYNTGVSNYAIHEIQNIAAAHKTPLADGMAVVNKLYPSAEKGSKSKIASAEVSSWYFKTPKENKFDIKTAQYEPIPNIEQDRCQDSKERELISLYRQYKLQLSKLKETLLQKEAAIQNTINNLIDYFRSASAIDPVEVSDNCYLCDKKLAAIFDQIYEKDLKKLASEKPFIRNVPVSWHQPPYSMLRNLYDYLEEYTALKENYELEKLAFDRINESIGSVKTAQKGKNNKAVSVSLGDLSFDSIGLNTKKPVSLLSKTLLTKHKSEDKDYDKKSKEIGVGKLLPSNALLQANAATIKVYLTDLMLNDPIISNYDPEEVYGAFAKIVQLAPTAASRSEILRVMLRKLLTAGPTGSLDPKDINDLVNLEEQLNRLIRSNF